MKEMEKNMGVENITHLINTTHSFPLPLPSLSSFCERWEKRGRKRSGEMRMVEMERRMGNMSFDRHNTHYSDISPTSSSLPFQPVTTGRRETREASEGNEMKRKGSVGNRSHMVSTKFIFPFLLLPFPSFPSLLSCEHQK